MPRRRLGQIRGLLCLLIAAQALAPALHRLVAHDGAAEAAAAETGLHAAAEHPAPASPAHPEHGDRDCAVCTLASVAIPAIPPGAAAPALRIDEAPAPIGTAAPPTFAWPAALIRGPPPLQVI